MSGGGGVGGGAGLGGATPTLGPTAVWVNNNNSSGGNSSDNSSQPTIQHMTDQLGGLHLSQNAATLNSSGLSAPIQQPYFTLSPNSAQGFTLGSGQLQSSPLTNGFHQQVAAGQGGGGGLPLHSSTPLPQVLSAPAHTPLSFSISMPMLGEGSTGGPASLQGGLAHGLQSFNPAALQSASGYSTLQSPSSSFSSLQNSSSASSFSSVQSPSSSFSSVQSPLSAFSPSYNTVSVGNALGGSLPLSSSMIHSAHGLPVQSMQSLQQGQAVQHGAQAQSVPLGHSVQHNVPVRSMQSGQQGQLALQGEAIQHGANLQSLPLQGHPGGALPLHGDVRLTQSYPGMSGHGMPLQTSLGNSGLIQGSPLHAATSLGNSASQHLPLQGQSSLPLNTAMGLHQQQQQQAPWQGGVAAFTRAAPTPPPAPPAPPLPSPGSVPSYSSYNNSSNIRSNVNNNNNNGATLSNSSSSNSLSQLAQGGAMLRELQAQIEARTREHHHTQELEAKAHAHGNTSPVPLPGMTGEPCHTVAHDASDPGIGPAGSATAEFYSTFSRPNPKTGAASPLHGRADSVGSGYSGPESAGESSPVLYRSLNRQLTRTDSAGSVLSNSSLGGTAEFYSTFGHSPSPALVRADSLSSCHSEEGSGPRSGEVTPGSRVAALREEATVPEPPPKVLPEPKPCYDKPRQKDLCMRCGKKVYAMEKVGPPVKDVMYHKHCFSCVVCGTTLTLKNFHHNPNDIDDLNIFCGPHTPVVRAAAMDADSVDIRRALHVPKPRDKINEQIRSGPSSHGLNDVEAVAIRSALHAPKRDIPSYEKFQTTHFNPWDT